MPSWEASTNKPLAKSKREVDKVRLFLQCYFHSSMNSPRVVNVFVFLFLQHQIETNLILKYSPFKTESQLFEQFNKIGPKGKAWKYNVLLIGV